MLAHYDAAAAIRGGEDYPEITGTVGFCKGNGGTWVDAVIDGLPPFQAATKTTPQIGPHGFHIHEGGDCGGTAFSDAEGHWNPDGQPHGNHKGDFPMLFSNHGKARMLFFTDRFLPEDVIGKTVIIHASPDDDKTQPAGGSGMRIACGVILAANG